MYKIGDFSKVVDLPVRTLRYYDEAGVLVPSETDIFTGYRYYSDEDILECELVKLLKSLDFTLDEIREYKGCLDQDIIERKKEEIASKIEFLKLKYDHLSILQQQLSTHSASLNSDTKRLILRRESEDEDCRNVA